MEKEREREGERNPSLGWCEGEGKVGGDVRPAGAGERLCQAQSAGQRALRKVSEKSVKSHIALLVNEWLTAQEL